MFKCSLCAHALLLYAFKFVLSYLLISVVVIQFVEGHAIGCGQCWKKYSDLLLE